MIPAARNIIGIYGYSLVFLGEGTSVVKRSVYI